MEVMVKKYEKIYKKVKEQMNKWDESQTELIFLFRSASSIIERLAVIQNPKKYGVDWVGDAVLRKQMQSLESILVSMATTMEEFGVVVLCLEKMVRDSKHLVTGVANKQLQLRVGIKPTLADCLNGVTRLHQMHLSEYLLKSSVVSALAKLALKPSEVNDLGALQQLLSDQPNIPKEEVQSVFDTVFAEDIQN